MLLWGSDFLRTLHPRSVGSYTYVTIRAGALHYSQIQRVRVSVPFLHRQHKVGDTVHGPGLVLVVLAVLLGKLEGKTGA